MSRSILSSHGLLIATVIAVSAGTLILLSQNYSSTSQHSNPGNQILKSCLSSGSKKKDGKKKKKKVHFADDVKDSSENGDEYRKVNKKVPGMPANHVAMYNGLLKDRLQKMAYSF